MSRSIGNLNSSDISFIYSTLEEIGVEEEEEREVETIFNNPRKFYTKYSEEKHEYDNIFKQNKLKYYFKIIHGVFKMLVLERTFPLVIGTLFDIPTFTIGFAVVDKLIFSIINLFRKKQNVVPLKGEKFMFLYKCIITIL